MAFISLLFNLNEKTNIIMTYLSDNQSPVQTQNEDFSSVSLDLYFGLVLSTLMISVNLLISYYYNNSTLSKKKQKRNKWMITMITAASFIVFDTVSLFYSSQRSFHAAKLFIVAMGLIYSTIFITKIGVNQSVHQQTNLSRILLAQAFLQTIPLALLTWSNDQKTKNIKIVLSGLSFVFTLCTLLFTRRSTDFGIYFTEETQDEITRAQVTSIFLASSTILLVYFSRPAGEIIGRLLQIAFVFFLNHELNSKHRRAAEQLEKRLQERTELMLYFSHEMRKPLNSAFLGTNMSIMIGKDIETLLEDGFEDDEELRGPEACFRLVQDQLDALSQVQQSCNVVLSTMDDILTFDKLSEGKLTIEACDLDPWILLQKESQPFRFQVVEKALKLKIHCVDEEKCWFKKYVVKGDPFKLGQVIRNLLSNAVKFSPHGGMVEVQLELIPPLAPEDSDSERMRYITPTDVTRMIKISVKDQGAGITEEDQQKLFQQNVQIQPGKLQLGKCSGIGLWISRRIIELHGGEIGVYSEGKGFGSIFTVTLPTHHVTAISLQKPFSTLIAPGCFITDMLHPSDTGLENQNPTTESFQPLEEEELDPTTAASLLALRVNTSTFRTTEVGLNGLRRRRTPVAPAANTSSFLLSPSPKVGSSISSPGFKSPLLSTDTLSSSSSTVVPNLYRVESMMASANEMLDALTEWDKGLHFLVVDDSESNRKLMKKVLERHGQSVEVASDGVQCLELIQQQMQKDTQTDMTTESTDTTTYIKATDATKRVEVVLLDDRMPGLSGVETTRLLRNRGFRGGIFGVTGDVELEKRQGFLNAGADGVLEKPLDLAELKQLWTRF